MPPEAGPADSSTPQDLVRPVRRVCASCLLRIQAQRPARYCGRCGRPDAATSDCPLCSGRQGPPDAVSLVGYYEGFLRQAIVQWKFGRCPGLDLLLGELVADSLGPYEWIGRVEGLVPIPQPWTRWLARRSFPVGELAEQVARRIRRPVWPILAARRHPPQVGLDGEARMSNMSKVFRLRGNVDVKDRRLCLLDDVTTTGATLTAAARVLKLAGAREVFAAVVARTL